MDMENSANSVLPQGKFLTNKIVSVQSNICITQHDDKVLRFILTKSCEFWRWSLVLYCWSRCGM